MKILVANFGSTTFKYRLFDLDDVSCLDLDFTVTENFMGNIRTEDLKPGGADVLVENSNLQEYLSQKKMNDDMSDIPQKPAAENIIDSRITEKRPEANVTIEKRKLLNNNLVKGEDMEHIDLMDMAPLSAL